jgi:hypothetical protein
VRDERDEREEREGGYRTTADCLYRNPPEVRDGFTHTKAGDVYQLGLMALELALGYVPEIEN